HRGHHAMLAASPADVLETVRDAPTRQTAESFERQRWTRAVARQSLAPEVVARFDTHVRMKVEPVALDNDGCLDGAPPVVVLRVLLTLARQRRDLAASHGDGGARVDRSLRGGLVRAVLHWPIVAVAMAPEPRSTPLLHARDNRLEVGEGRRRCWVE